MAHRDSGDCYVHVFVQPCFHGSPYDANLVPLRARRTNGLKICLNPTWIQTHDIPLESQVC